MIFIFSITFRVEASHPNSCAGISVCITNVQITKTHNSATITWTTNVPSATNVQYWTNPTRPFNSPSNSSNTSTSHTANLPNLTPNTLYNFRIFSNASDSPSHTDTFTTNRPPTNDQVIISAVSDGNRTQNGVTITWTTNIPATSQVKYWEGSRDVRYEPQNPGSNLTTSHSITLRNLNPNTNYSYQVLSTANNFPAQGTVGTFRTQAGPCTDPVCISGEQIKPGSLTPTSVTIMWTTNVPSSSKVQYNVASNIRTTPEDTRQVTNHEVTVTGLSPGGRYGMKGISHSPTLDYTARGSGVTVNMGGVSGQTPPQPGSDVFGGFRLTNPWTGVDNIFDAIDKITNFLITIAVPIAVILIIWAGIIFLTSMGNPGKITKARTILLYVMIGFAVLLIGKGFFLLIESALNLGN